MNSGNVSEAQKMLIIDDHSELRTYLRQMFMDKFIVITEDSGERGLESAFMHYPDIIISDIMMPGMDGIEFCRRLKSDVRISHIPVVLLTALMHNDTKVRGLELGADDYVEKPFDERILKLKVDKILKAKALISKKYSEGMNNGSILRPGNVTENEFMEKVLVVINENLSNSDFGVNDLIKEVGVSRAVFYRKIKEVTKKNAVELIQSLRLYKAAELLRNSSLQISEVAIEVGFNDTSYFIKLFKGQFGQTPGEYRH